jgi:hypothetical protein
MIGYPCHGLADTQLTNPGLGWGFLLTGRVDVQAQGMPDVGSQYCHLHRACRAGETRLKAELPGRIKRRLL